MSRSHFAFNLNGHLIDGELSVCNDPNDESYIQAILTIPEEGEVRDIFNLYLKDEQEGAQLTLKWVEVDRSELLGYIANGIIINRQFPATRFAIFRSVGPIKQKVFDI